jgi:competence protein ComEA
MNKKLIITGMCCFVLISGICYSCSFKSKQTPVLINSVTDEIKSDKLSQANIQPTQTPSVSSEKDGKELNEGLIETEEARQSSENTMVYVHVCGAVKNPGVFKVKSDARIIDIIVLSGGMTKDAAGDYINQASKVQDGQRIYIPTNKELEELSTSEYIKGELDNSLDPKQAGTSSTLVNINTASEEELMKLPGIGQAKASSIIDYRTTEGQFQTTTDLMKIPGIKEGLYNKLSSYITVN